MVDKTGKVIYGPWSKYIGEPMLFEDFRELARKKLNDFIIDRDSLSYVSKLFRGERDIWPDQCERALSLIRSIKNAPVKDTCQLLDAPSRLPQSVIPYRYPLAVALYYLDEQIDILIKLITLFRTICRQSIAEVIKKREEINCQFELLMKSYEDAMHEFATFLDRIYFYERKNYG